MPSDIVLSSELKSLQQEVTAAHRERQPAPPPAPDPAANPVRAADAISVAAGAAAESVEGQALRDQLGELVDQVTQFFEDAEKNIAAHPAESVIAALLLGILIGRLLGRG